MRRTARGTIYMHKWRTLDSIAEKILVLGTVHTRTWGAQDWVKSKTWLVRGQNENSVPTAAGFAVEVLSMWRWRNYCYLTE